MTSAVITTMTSKITPSEVVSFPETGDLQSSVIEVESLALDMTSFRATQPHQHTTNGLSCTVIANPFTDTKSSVVDEKSLESSKTDNLRRSPDQTGSVATEKATAPGSVPPSTSMPLTDTKVSSESKHDHGKETLDPGAVDPVTLHDGVPWTLHDAPAPAKTPDKPPNEQKASSAAVANEAMQKRAISLPMDRVLTVAMDGTRVKPARLRQGRSARLEADKTRGLDQAVPTRRSHWSDDCGLL